MDNLDIDHIKLEGNGKKRILKSIVLQSPLAGVSDQIFRKLVRRWAPEALLFTEMVNAKSLGLGYGKIKVFELIEEQGPIGVQLFDSRLDTLVEAAKQAEDAGAFLVDINMGCPVKKIAKKGGGSALLKNIDLACEIVNAVANSIKIPVTVKTRLGWCDKTSNPVSLGYSLQEAGAQMLTVHGRTRKQAFSGKANWDAIFDIKKKLTIPVIANGDINTPGDAEKCLKITQANGVMIGRGSMGAPWLVGQIDAHLKGDFSFKVPSPKEKLTIALEQLNDLLSAKGEHGLLVARKHLNLTCTGFEGSKEFRRKLLNTQTPSKAISILEEKINSIN